ncbi:MAG: hypothetical protein U0223_10170 [Nitrospira sp.]
MSHYCPPPWCFRSTKSNMVMSMILCSFKVLENDMARITTKCSSFDFEIGADLKEALETLKEDLMEKYKTSTIPSRGIAVLTGRTLKDAVVVAFFPFTIHENFDEYLSPIEQAVAQYSEWFDEAVEVCTKKDLQGSAEVPSTR